MDDVTSLHAAEYQHSPCVVTSAPGVANLMGAHTEATDGLVLLFGMTHRAAVAVSLREDNSLRFHAPDLKERKRTGVAAIRFRKEDHFANLAKGVISRLQTLGARIHGANVTITSDIPSGIGLGASQAITTALALALAELYGFTIDAVVAAQIAHHAERAFCSSDVGLSSFLASALSRRHTAMLIDTHRLDWSYIQFDLNGDSLLGIDTHAPSSDTPEEAAKRVADCELCLNVLAGGRHATSLQDVSMQELYSGLGLVPEHARRHCLHVVGENERVLQMVDALRRRDMGSIGKLLLQSHESLRDLYEVSTPEVDWVVRHAGEVHGVYGARLAGGSRSSCALALATRDAVDVLRERLHDYERIFGFHPDIVPCGIDDGVRIDLRRTSDDPCDQ
jgi:galactokinase